ncbi:hypothetical protein AN963_22970 [Brevibacillus choshinensis]|uniref:Uncharacterized protein n=1 Tax=Brevibacillus choshinensis TaxID=54911 RepID=A0ABR5N1A0_BRECH|nr:hypothetical protein AN963_22970 [Brevibacillus choshinensis]
MKPCPSCGTDIVINEGYPLWCDRCDWNLAIPAKIHRSTSWERMEVKMRHSYGQSLFKELQEQQGLLTKKGMRNHHARPRKNGASHD